MATWYVNSAATGTGAGTSWVNATTTMAAAITLSAAGDDFDVLSTHAETQASLLTLTFKGTAASPNRVFSCDNTNAPAHDTDLLAGASISTTGASGMTINGFVYFYGFTFNVGSGANTAALTLAGASSEQFYDTCQLKLVATNANNIKIGGGAVNSAAKVTLYGSSTVVSFGGAASSGFILGGGATLDWKYANLPGAVAGTAVTSLFALNNANQGGCYIFINGVDLTGVASGKNIFGASTASVIAQVMNCKLTSGVVVAAVPNAPGARIDLINSDSGATGYRQESYQFQGTLTASTTVALSGGASDSVQAISWKVVTTANAKRQSPFECFPIPQWWGAGLGSSHTFTIQVLGPAGLTNADIWVEFDYMGTSGSPVSWGGSTAPGSLLTAGSNLSTSGAGSWSGSTGLTAYTISTTFVPQIAGDVRFTVKIAKPSTTIYVDPYPIIV